MHTTTDRTKHQHR